MYHQFRIRSAHTSFLTVIVGCVKLGVIIWYLNACDDQMVLLIRCVRTQHQPMNCIILSIRSS